MRNGQNRISRAGQITIFIIVGILIVVAIGAFFLLSGDFDFQEADSKNPEQFIENCIKDAVGQSVEKVLAGGGVAEPDFYKMYLGEQYNYLCYQRNYYIPCINQYPMLKSITEEEIKQDSEDGVKECFDSLKKDWEKRGYSVSSGSLSWNVEIVPKQVRIEIDKPMIFSKDETSETYSEFSTNIFSPLYELIMVARQISNEESQFCNFEYNGFMLLYPEFSIQVISYDGSRIYRVADRRTGDLFKFAVRSCEFPPGL